MNNISMNEPHWRMAIGMPGQGLQAVWRIWPNGRQESCLVTTPEYLKWISEGNQPLPADEEQK